jgi:hypothetical protein
LLEKPARQGNQAGFQFGKFRGKNFRPDNLRFSRRFLVRDEIALFSSVPNGRGRARFRSVGYRRPVRASTGDCEVFAPAPETAAHHDRQNTDDVSAQRDRAPALSEMPYSHDAGADIACGRGTGRAIVRMPEMRPRRNGNPEDPLKSKAAGWLASELKPPS